MDEASAGALANYSLSAGTISGIKFYKGSPGVVLTVSGLTAGSTYTVTVKDVADKAGNKMTVHGQGVQGLRHEVGRGRRQ